MTRILPWLAIIALSLLIATKAERARLRRFGERQVR